MDKRESDKSQSNSKVFATDWYQKVLPFRELNSHHQRIFNTFLGSLDSTSIDPNLEDFSRLRATPVSKFTLPAFTNRLKLLQKVRIRDIKQTFKKYNEN